MHWDDPEGWDGEGGGRKVSSPQDAGHPWLIHVTVWQKPLQYCKVKKIKKNKIKTPIQYTNTYIWNLERW